MISRRDLLKGTAIASVASLFSPKSMAGMFLRGGSVQAANYIGGVAIGTAGSGIYSGYTMAGGDDFIGPLNIVSSSTPNGKYFPTIAYEAGARGTTYLLGEQYDSDPYNSGANDANRGVALGSQNLSQANSVLTLNARIENATETGKIGSGRTLTSSMIHSGGAFTFSAPCIIEAYVKFSGGTLPSGWHTDFWLLNAFPVNSELTNPDGSMEIGNEAKQDNNDQTTPPTYVANLFIPHGTVPGLGYVVQSGTMRIFDGNWHLLTMILGTSNIQYYLDGTLISTIGQPAIDLAKPFYILYTNHIINPATIADWTTAGQTGVSMAVDYHRLWLPSANYPSGITSPSENLPNIQVAYNTSMTYTFPSASILWGSAITDYCQAIKFEDYEPGSDVSFAGDYLQFPSGLTWNSSTRTLTGVTTDMQPGRIHTAATPYISGGTIGNVARGYIDVGPHITETTASYSNGTGSLDMYYVGNCGTLLPKTLAITGLPTGLSFSPTTGLITGTATPGTYTISMSVTNSVGQTATQNIALTVGA